MTINQYDFNNIVTELNDPHYQNKLKLTACCCSFICTCLLNKQPDLRDQKTTKMIYVASPYTYKSNIPLVSRLVHWWRYREVTKYTGRLQNIYPFAFIGPITQSHQTVKFMNNTDTGFSMWERRDLTYISKCDELWIIPLPGWEESVGVQKEIQFAKEMGIIIKIIDLYSLIASELYITS